MELAKRLKMVRESLGYSQKEMAKAINVYPQTWRIYESGKSVPGGNVLETMARLGFNVNWILTGEGEMRRGEEGQSPSKPLALNEELLNSIIISVVEFTHKTGDKEDVKELALSTAMSIIQLYNLLNEFKKNQNYTPEMIANYITFFRTIADICNGDADVIKELFHQALKTSQNKAP